jgi:hypothetical protein
MGHGRFVAGDRELHQTHFGVGPEVWRLLMSEGL